MTRFCPKCQAETERNKSGDCKPCGKIRAVAYRSANIEKIKAKKLIYRAINIEKIKAKDIAYRTKNVEQLKVKSADYYAANRQKLDAANLSWAKANPEKIKAISKTYRIANRVAMNAAIAAWRIANPKTVRIHKQNRRARKLKNGGILSKGLAAKLFKLQQGKCPCCHQPLGDDYHLDHIVPLALGGSNTDDNMQLLTATCNLQKNAKHPIDFMQQKGFLL
jgi:5-methylcytosine-specific restriction endonuclease McrA